MTKGTDPTPKFSSVAEEIESQRQNARPFTTEHWWNDWLAGLPENDRDYLAKYLANPSASPTPLARTARNHGYPKSVKTFTNWVSQRRGNNR